MSANGVISLVLSSSLLVGVISALVTYFINKKNNSLKYVTEERKLWREEIRSIVEELENTRMNDRQKVLQKLKVRINPYGLSDNLVMHDSHIWTIMHDMETTNSNKEYKVKKDKLILYLSLLLKYDWERAKKEVKGDGNTVGLLVTFIFGSCYLLYKHFIEYKMEYNDVFLCAAFVLLMMPIVAGQNLIYIVLKDAWNKKRKNKFIGCCARAGIIVIYLGFIWGCICFVIYILTNYNFHYLNILTGKGYFDTCIVVTIMTLLFVFSRKMTMYDITDKYIKEVELYKE